MNEAEIVNGCRHGDREAQRELYALTCDRVYRVLLRIVRNEDDAFDLAQETYLRVFAKIGQFNGDSSVGTWIYRIAVNEGLQFQRRHKRVVVGLEDSDSASARAVVVESPDLRMDVRDALGRLPEAERILIMLRYFEGLNYAEMAEILEKPAGTIASGLNRAREMLRRLLEERRARARA